MPGEPTPELNPDKTIGYRLAAGLVAVLSWLVFHPRVTGREHIPESGPVIIAPIHRSNLDFAFTLFISRRKVFFMSKDSLFRVPVLGRALRHLGAFPVRRGSADRESTQLAEAVLRRGYPLVLFPEGTRKEGLTVGPLHDGAMFVAARTGARVVPVGIGGTERAMPKGSRIPRPARVRIVIGPALEPPRSDGRVSRTQIAEKSEELRAALESAYRSSMGL